MIRAAAFAAAALFATAVAGQASVAKGTYWDALAGEFDSETFSSTGPGMQTAIDYALANTPTATFSVSGPINYGDSSANWVIGSLATFLQGDAGSISGTDDGSMQESVFRITGKARFENGKTYTVTSDDGFRLIVGGTVLSQFGGLRGPNNSTTATWTGATGTYATTLWYYEGQFRHARLTTDLAFVAPVPVPAGIALGLTGLGGLGYAARRQRRKAA